MRLSEIMSHAGLSRFAEIALVLFLVAFVAIVLRIFRPGARARMEHDARLPLDDDDPTGPGPREGGGT
jgi:cbb3-type cytochrome oxidase subunit 3